MTAESTVAKQVWLQLREPARQPGRSGGYAIAEFGYKR
jgi:hypothetical protein